MSFNIFDFLTLIGALGLFIYGMKVMSDSIQKVAGSKLREILGAMTSNRYVGIFTGLLITVLVQSSSATTVMVVSFVNAGLITLVESIGVIMGANIGTTVTGWLISELGLGKVSISALCLPIISIGFPMMFAKREKIKLWGEVLIGFAILFLGLSFMKDAVSGLSENAEMLSFLQGIDYDGKSFFGKFGITALFVIVGTVLTIVVQSSSAAMALTLVLCNAGWISFPLAAAIILGENIGTTITANLAALIANVHAKRAARAHFIFNVFGVIWLLLVFPFFLDAVRSLSISIWNQDPFETATAIPKALALFHTTFNIINVLLLVGFVGLISRIVVRMVPSKGQEDEVFNLDYIGSGMMATPELSILEAKKELAKFGDLMRRAYKFVPQLVTEMDDKKLKKAHDQLAKYEDIGDRMEVEIATYLSKASEAELSSEASKTVRSMLEVANYLERIGDIYLEISRNLKSRKEKNAYFTQDMRDNIAELSTLVSGALDLMVKNIEAPNPNKLARTEAIELEDQINRTYKRLREEYIKRVEKGKIRVKSGVYYIDLLSELERIGDHIVSISESLVSKPSTLPIEEG
jgi:phosphate:Na+ symporter